MSLTRINLRKQRFKVFQFMATWWCPIEGVLSLEMPWHPSRA